ncbi:FAD-dependent oxidoreductase [Sutterella sp.]|uniref:FAD-dependent oxidoreductase n=1 Tax=Sutterella sp. TaxID=1981025 RepID=UPI0026DEDD16|nr:FAD-dependent oxidoreductase [Sutterella sp.]MDO5531395.1 FAD-dependent oxidoreductase [Sutterella sp.]
MHIHLHRLTAAALTAALFTPIVSPAAVTAGTYEAEAAGKLSPVRASVTVDASGRITDLSVDVSGETPDLGGAAAKQMVPAILEHQSTAVDGVSGATVSSEAIRSAVVAALAKAGADPKAYDVKVEKAALPAEEITTDVVVIGAGASGTAAALAAAEAGVRVTVLEKAPAAGGASKIAMGLFAVESSLMKEKYGSDPELMKVLTKDNLYRELMDYNHYLSNARITRKVIDLSASTVDWLKGYGVDLRIDDKNLQQGQNPYPLRWRIYHQYVDSPKAFENMYAALGEMGGELITGARAYDIETAPDGSVSAVIAEKSGGAKLTVHAKAVIIASGGFGGDAKHLSRALETENVTNRIAWSNNGEGLEMAWKAGAQKLGEGDILIHGAEFDGLASSASKGGAQMQDSNLLVRVLKTPLMWVDTSGKRFANEELIYDTVLWANAAYSAGGKYFVVCDAATLDTYTADALPFEVSGAGPLNPEGKGDFRALAEEAVRQGVGFKADTLEELAKLTGFEAGFEREVADYNEAVRTGSDPYGKPAEFLKFTVEKGPFYAFRARVVSLSTLGGVRVNENMQALNGSGEVVKGLYAVGNNAYGFYSAPSYPPYQGLALGFAYNSGRIAGADAAAKVKNADCPLSSPAPGASLCQPDEAPASGPPLSPQGNTR